MTGVAKKGLSITIKAAILILAFAFIYHQFIEKGDNLKQFANSISKLNTQHVTIILCIVVLLMLGNWFTECIKWRFVVRKVLPLTIWQAVEGVFCGLTWAIFTPSRIGEYGGRVMFLPPRKRIHGVFAMAVGAFGQIVLTNILGAIASVWFCYTFLGLNNWALAAISLFATLYIVMLSILFFNVKWLSNLLNRISFTKKYHRFFNIIREYKAAELARVMYFCTIRYAIFTFQYYMLIHLLIPGLAYHVIVLMVIIVLFVQSFLPSLDVLDVPVRATVSATVFDYVTNQQLVIIAAFSLIWLINIIVPAVLGSVFVLKLKFFDRNN